jgi:hypothetical protein
MRGASDEPAEPASPRHIKQSGPESIRDGLPGDVRSMSCRENIHDRAFYRGDRHSLMLADLLRCEVGAMNHDPFRVLPPQLRPASQP